MSFPFPVARLYRKHYAGGGEIGDDGTEMDIDPGVEPGRISNNIPIRTIDGQMVYPGDAGNPIIRLPVPAVGLGRRMNPVGAPPVEEVPAGISRPVADEPPPAARSAWPLPPKRIGDELEPTGESLPNPDTMPIRRIGLRAPVDFSEADTAPEGPDALAVRRAMHIAARRPEGPSQSVAGKVITAPEEAPPPLVAARTGEPLTTLAEPVSPPRFLAAEQAPDTPVYRAGYETHPNLVPQGRKSNVGPVGSDTPIVGIDALRSSSIGRQADLFDRNIGVIRRYDNVPRQLQDADSETMLNYYVEHGLSNLLFLHDYMRDQMPEGVYDGSKLWYPGARRLTDEAGLKYGLPDYAMASNFANLSPQRDWNMNRSLGDRVADITINRRDARFDDRMKQQFDLRAPTKEGSRMTAVWQLARQNLERAGSYEGIDRLDIPDKAKQDAKALFVRLHDESYNDRKYEIVVPNGTLGNYARNDSDTDFLPRSWGSLDQIASAIGSVEAAGHPERISELVGDANKVRNFYNNILDPFSPNQDVTMDTHAVAALLLRPLSGASFEVHHNFGSSPQIIDREKQYPINGGMPWEPTGGSGAFGVHGLYPVNADIYRLAAAARKILPREMQSITWEAARGLFPKVDKRNITFRNANRAIWDAFRNGQMTLREAQERVVEAAGGIATPDWYTGGFRP